MLISVYQNEIPEYLDIALNSIEKQTLQPTEIVLVEDGPISRKLKRVILLHKKSFGGHFKDIVCKNNRGLGVALRIGLNYVSTDWVARMDSDDYSLPDRFQKQMDAILSEPDIAIIGGQVKEFAGEITNIVGSRKVPTTEKSIKRFSKWRSPFNHPTVMLNKKRILDVGSYQSFGNLEDYYLWIRVISNRQKVKNLNSYLTYMRVDGGMYSRRGKIHNITYSYRLRNYLYTHNMINQYERVIGNLVMTANIIVPTPIRKLVYQQILHKKR